MSMVMGKHVIAANPADLANGDSIASYLVDAAGALITSTLIGAKQSLDTKDTSSHLQGSAYAAGVDYLMSAGVVNNAGNWVPFTLNAAGELPVAATVNFAGDYAEDSAHASGDVGLFSLSVRRDTRSSGTSADGDYASFNTNAVGELWVKDADALAQLILVNSELDSITAELVLANSSLDAIESDVDAIRVELLDQGTTLDAILAEVQAFSFAEDSAHASGDMGIQSLLVRQDTLASSTSADGDYGSFKSNAAGELYVVDSTVRSLITALSKAEDAAHASGDQGIQALAVRKDAQGTNTSADGDYSSLQTWSEGSLKVVDIANGSILQSQVSVTDTATLLPASALANRRSLMIQNTGANKLWIGSATVTTTGATSGIELPANSFIELEVGPAVGVYAIKNGATGSNVNLLQLA